MPTYKDEKTGTWFVKCYYTDYMGNKKQKKKRGFARQKDAKEWEYSFLSSLQYDSDTTFGSVSNDFIEENTPRRRKTTIYRFFPHGNYSQTFRGQHGHRRCRRPRG